MTFVGENQESSQVLHNGNYVIRRLSPKGTRPIGAIAAIVGAIVVAAFAGSTPGFFTVSNLQGTLISASVVGVLAIGETFIMLGGSLFSLSIATTSAVVAMCFAEMLPHGYIFAIVISLLLGTAVSALQGFVVGRWRANPIIVTIAAGSLEQGIAGWLTGDHDLALAASGPYVALINPVFGLPASVWIFFGVAIVGQVLLSRSRFGSELYMLGDSQRAARAVPLRITRITVISFGIAGVCAAISGILLAAQYTNASLSVGGNDTYSAITAVLVGGTSIIGGRGSVLRTVIGGILVAAVVQLVILRGYSTGIQILVEGVIVLVAIVVVRVTQQ